MDIILQTNTENPFLAFRNIHRFSEADGSTLVAIRSGWITANFLFFFALGDLRDFIQDLEGLDATLAGRARFLYRYEEHFLQFEGNGLGSVDVNGEFSEWGPREQRVTFAFATDQTCLRPFILALRNFLESHRAG